MYWRRVSSVARVTTLVAAMVGVGVWMANAASPSAPRLEWFGQSCFLLETPAGTRIVMDPLAASVGFPLPENLEADVVTVSHEHPEHNNIELARGKPKILRGLTPDKKGWLKIAEKFRDVSIRSIGVYHDETLGKVQGLNTIFVFETGGLRIAHMGDLGHTLNDTQLSQLGSVDVVLIPVGGHNTIDAAQAARVVEQIRPRLVVIPMHYGTGISTSKELATVERFLEGRTHVRRVSGNSLVINAVKQRPGAEVVVLERL